MGAAVSLNHVSKQYRTVPVVDNLSFDIEAGEIFGLLGPNGAGKSTTIRMLTTLTQPTAGQIQVSGHDVARDPFRVKQCIGVVLQQISVDPDLTVWENMELHGRLHHLPTGKRRQAIERWLGYVALENRRNDVVKSLSGGMKRRLQLARAMLHQPQVLFLDEPTVGLDPQTRRRLWEIIRDLNRQGTTMLLTTHYMEEVEYLCRECSHGKPGRIGILDRGQLIELGTLDQLRQKHGEGLVMKQVGERWDYQFFPTVADANDYLNQQADRTGMMVRPSNLEDIFVELTGRNLD